MKIQAPHFRTLLTTGLLAAVTAAGGAQAAVTQQIEPARIAVGDAAQLTIAASGDTAQPISPPMVSGLEFIAVGQSQRVESVNGVTHSTSAVTYQVIPRKAGVFNIPGAAGTPAVTLTVTEANGTSGATGAIPPVAGGTSGAAHASAAAAPAAVSADGSAFVRLSLPKHQLYVGETIPVDIEVGTRDGVVATMNGPPTLNGDAFVLEKLSNEPQRSMRIIDGAPFTVFTWHSALAAVKPGSLSLTLQTPLTVRVSSPSHLARQFFDDPDGFFDQANLQNFFGGVTDKDVTVASAPATFKVLALPVENRPAGFSGAVGHFNVTSELTDDKAAVGDPLTLRLRIAGTGNFDRVDTQMLHDPDHWKTYAPTAKFIADDAIGAKGVKIFEQPVIATEPGEQSVPSLSFSWFDPDARRYEMAHTAPLIAAIAPASGDRLAARNPVATLTGSAPAATPGPALAAAGSPAGSAPGVLRPDHADRGGGVSTLRPLYARPAYLAAPPLLVVALSGALLWLRRRDRDDDAGAALATEPLIRVMDDASTSGDAETFFKAARAALQRTFAPKWQLPPEDIDIDTVEAHFDPGSDVVRVFRLADEVAYGGTSRHSVDFPRWKRLILRRIHSEALT